MSTTPLIEDLNFDVIEETREPKSYADKWTILATNPSISSKANDLIHRLNALGSLFYFTKIVLRKHRLTLHLHKPICDALEKDAIKELLEIPRDHFKSTICSEAYPMWRALPFTNTDRQYMQALGYSEEWLRWMAHAHNQDNRCLLVTANIKNANKIGKRIDFHYQENSFFKGLFPEILPEKSDSWSVESMTHRRSGTARAGQGEGTYDMLGVGAALQSRHYDQVIEDDLVGLDSLDSELVMQSVIDYHKLVVGAFDSVPNRPDLIGDNVVVGNRWQYEDLNSYLREFEKDFRVTSHSAEGGCCKLHPLGKSIFPEEFTMSKLKKIESRLGTYFYSCQYLNRPTPPGQEKFREEWLKFYHFERSFDSLDQTIKLNVDSKGRVTEKSSPGRIKIIHNTYEGKVLPDIYPINLERKLILDPNHAGKNGRSRHSLIVVGYLNNPTRMYLLDLWAGNESYEELIENFYRLGEKWKIKQPYIEGIAFQKFIRTHLNVIRDYRKKDGKWTFDNIDEDHLLKVDLSEDGKNKRIEGMEPVYRRGEFWVSSAGMEQFLEEYRKYPYSKYKDILDTLGYALTLWEPGRKNQAEVQAWLMKANNYRNGQSQSITGY